MNYMIFHCENKNDFSSHPDVVVAIPVEQRDDLIGIPAALQSFGLSSAHKPVDVGAFVLEQSSTTTNLVDVLILHISESSTELIPNTELEPETLDALEEANEFEWDLYIVVNEYEELYVEATVQDGWTTLQSTRLYPLDAELEF